MKEIKLDQPDVVLSDLDRPYDEFVQSFGRIYDWVGLARGDTQYAILVNAAITELTNNSWVRWAHFTRNDGPPLLRHLQGLAKILSHIEKMLDYPWPPADQETVLAALSRLYVGVTLLLASQRFHMMNPAR